MKQMRIEETYRLFYGLFHELRIVDAPMTDLVDRIPFAWDGDLRRTTSLILLNSKYTLLSKNPLNIFSMT